MEQQYSDSKHIVFSANGGHTQEKEGVYQSVSTLFQDTELHHSRFSACPTICDGSDVMKIKEQVAEKENSKQIEYVKF